MPLVAEPDRLDLGTLGPGQSATSALTLRNPTSFAIDVERVRTSCPCLVVRPQAFRVEPGASKMLSLCFDPTKDSAFRGGLAVEASGIGSDDATVFRAKVALTIHEKD